MSPGILEHDASFMAGLNGMASEVPGSERLGTNFLVHAGS